MTNEKILRRWADSQVHAPFDLSTVMNFARADEREQLKDQIPPVGSGPWAIMQHLSGETLKFDGTIWNPEEEPTQIPRLGLIAYSGWSIVPDEPKPMTFKEGDWVHQDGRKYELRGGQWFPC